MMEPSQIKEIIRNQLPKAEVWVDDLTGTRDHFQVIVVSDQFEGLSMVKQHQLVYGALKEEMKEAIHALTLKTFTPEQYKQQMPPQSTPRGLS